MQSGGFFRAPLSSRERIYMTNQELSELIALFDRSTALTMKLSEEGFSLELDRRGRGEAAVPPVPQPAAPEESGHDGKWVRAPLVGTFYAAPGPDQPPFVKPGSHVAKGQTLCLIEAMKMMSEVCAPCECIIEETAAQNGQLLSYDAPIFRYREA